MSLILQLIRHSLHNHHFFRHFAKWVPYKPLPKPKHHQKLLTIKTLKSHLESSYLVSPFPSHGLSANQFKPLKNPLPSDPTSAKIVVVKNSLVSKAFAGTQYEKLGPCLKGMNSLMFVKKEELVGPALSGVKSAVKEKKMEFNEFTGAVIGGHLYGHRDLEVLERMPSRAEASGMILGTLFGPSSTLMAVLEGFAGSDAEKEAAAAGDESVESEGKDAGAAGESTPQ